MLLQSWMQANGEVLLESTNRYTRTFGLVDQSLLLIPFESAKSFLEKRKKEGELM